MKLSVTQLYSPKNMFLVNNLRAIAIMAVAYVHLFSYGYAIGDLSNKFIILILMPIAMPLFAFTSGFYHSKEVNTSSSSASVEKLLGLFLAGFIFMYPFRLLHLYQLESLNWKSAVISFFDLSSYGILWYIIALALWRLIAPVIVKVKYHMVLVLLLGLCSVFFTDSNNIVKGFFRYMPFYFFGLAFSWEKIVSLRVTKSKYYTLLGIALAFAIALVSKFIFKFELTPGEFGNSGQSLNFLLICGIYYIISFSLMLFIFSFMIGRRIRIFTQIGTNSMSVYVFHMYIVSSLAMFCVYPLLRTYNAPDIIVCLSQIVLFFLGVYLTSFNFSMKAIAKLSEAFYKLIFKIQ